jgi:O-antigen/teichoic acid export membrane protein
VDTNDSRPFPKQIMPQTDARIDTSLTAAARSSRMILGTQFLRLAVRVCGTVTLARLISPPDYGIFGMAATVHGLAYVFQDFGLATVTLRKPDLSESDRNALFWLNLFLGGTLSVVVAALGMAVASFFREPALRVLLPVMGTTFLINGTYTQLRAQLGREHRFIDLNRVEILAFTTSTAAAIAVAWLGGGAWALATMLLVAECALAIGIWKMQTWRPGPLPAKLSTLAFLPAGASLSTNDALRYVQRNVDLFLVGRWLGAGALGVYGRAAQVAQLPIIYVADPLANLTVSTLRHFQGSPAGARIFWCRLVNDLAWVTLPAAAMFACIPKELLAVLLGARWAPGAPVLLGLSAGVAVLPLQMACGWLFLATGSTRRLLVASSLNAVVVVVACVLLRGADSGGIAAGVGIATALCAAAGVAFIRTSDPVTPGDAIRAFARPFVAAMTLGAALLSAVHFCPWTDLLPRLCLGVGVYVVWMGIVWLVSPGARAEWREHFLWGKR